jgi:hypothetical protein
MNGNHEVEQMETETSWLKVELPLDNISENDHIFTGEKMSLYDYYHWKDDDGNYIVITVIKNLSLLLFHWYNIFIIVTIIVIICSH